MMDCKKALTEAGGDKEAAKKHLRERDQNQRVRSGRETAFGRFGILRRGQRAGAIVEVK
jgi:elongation factor Ts